MAHGKPGFGLQCFGYSVYDFVDHSGPRDVDVFECFSGVASVYNAAHAKQLMALKLDKEVGHPKGDVTEDVTTKAGFDAAVSCLLRVKRGGLATFAAKCSSFVAPCQANHQRGPANDYRGNDQSPSVQEGNMIADVTSFLVVLAYLRSVHPVLENPPQSKIWDYPPIAEAVGFVGAQHEAVVPRCAYDTAPDGQRYGKKFKFVSPNKWIEAVSKPCTCQKGHLKTTKQFVQANTGRAIKVGQVRWSGIKPRLVESGSYPVGLGVALVKAWQGELLPVGPAAGPANNTMVRKRPASAAQAANPSAKARVVSAQGTSAAMPSWMSPAASDAPPQILGVGRQGARIALSHRPEVARPDASNSEMQGGWLNPQP